MQDPEEAQAYYQRKEAKAQKRRKDSKFDYASAGGNYVPTKIQHDEALRLLNTELTSEQQTACSIVISGYSCSDKVHHDYIHVVNELIRNPKN